MHRLKSGAWWQKDAHSGLLFSPAEALDVAIDPVQKCFHTLVKSLVTYSLLSAHSQQAVHSHPQHGRPVPCRCGAGTAQVSSISVFSDSGNV